MKKNILILFFILFIGCGYKPIYSTSNTNFTINEIEYDRNKLNKIIDKIIYMLKRRDRKFPK